MANVSIFQGVVACMFYADQKPPHFHAEHLGNEAKFDFDGNMIAGDIKSVSMENIIKRWAKSRRKELIENWHRVIDLKPLKKIPPI
ncbi:MAG: hypothetical protein HW421_2047 [Ignavibacteria bacterium]|nr:hypothetical protein [Ignavibacteria bacterium]